MNNNMLGSITKCEVGNGSSVLFWSDLWKDNLFDSSFPRLFSYAKDKLQSVKEFFEMYRGDDFRGMPRAALSAGWCPRSLHDVK
jgi:hypothetical protein